MIDVGLPALAVLLVVGSGLLLWRRIRGPAPSRRHGILRAAALLVVVLLPALVAAWQLSRSPTAQLCGGLTARVETAEPLVALTFDDGPTERYTDEILRILSERGVRATFFVVGRAVERNPELAQRIAAGGHELGNHGFGHTPLIGRSLAFVRGEIERTDALIARTGYQGEVHFRPPNGMKLIALPCYLAATGRHTIMWDVGPEADRQVAADAGQIAAYVLAHARPGSIVLLHVMYESRAASRAALPAIIDGLQARGYRLVTVSELLAAAAQR